MSTQEERGGNRPRFRPDGASITAGLVFMAIGLIYRVFSDTRPESSARWSGSLLVLGLGLAWVIGLLTRRRR
jgi:hypothetical protein